MSETWPGTPVTPDEGWPGTPVAAPAAGQGWLPNALVRGVAGLVGLPRDTAEHYRATQGAILGAFLDPAEVAAVMEAQRRISPMSMLPTSQQVADWLRRQTGVEDVRARTLPGRLAEAATEFAAGSLIPGGGAAGLARNVAAGAASGLLSEAAGEAARGSALEPVARVAGALAPAGAGAAARAVRNPVARDAAEALARFTPQQVDAAQTLMRQAEAMGSPITLAEALQQVTGGVSRELRGLQDVAQTSVGGRRVMDPFLDRREAGAVAAAERFAAPLAPSGPDAPMVPVRVQEAAAEEVRAAYRARSEAVRPLYEAAERQAMQPGRAGAVRQIVFRAVQNLDRLAQRDQSGLLAPHLERIRQSFAAPFEPGAPQRLDWESVQDARRYFRDLMRARAEPGRPPVDRKIAGQALGVLNRLTDELQRAVPALREADATYARLTEQMVRPVERGIVGRVAETDSAAAQRALLFPRQPMAGQVPTTPEAAAEAVGRIAGTSPATQRRAVATTAPEDVRALLGAELRARLDEALQRRAAGPSERPGAAAGARLAPTEGRADALEAAMRQLPDGERVAEGFRRLMDVLSAQSYAPPRGSQTQPRLAAMERAGQGGVQGAARAVVNPFRTVPEWLERWRVNANTEDLARALTTPEGIARLRALARIDDPRRREAFVRALLTWHRAQTAATRE